MKKIKFGTLSLLGMLLCLQACTGPNKTNTKNANPDTLAMDQKKDQQMNLYTLRNKNGSSVTITDYGARIVSLTVPDKDNKLTDVVLGYANLKSYKKQGEPFFGAIIGRYGNRIGKGKFSLDEEVYQLQLNDGKNTLHGGLDGFHAKTWRVKQQDSSRIDFFYTAADGEGGYPGKLDVQVTYTFSEDNALKIHYLATSDKNTVVNLTNHAYFNLNGEGNPSILDHQLAIQADAYTPVDSTLIPTGAITLVKGTPFDFTKAKMIGKDIDENNQQLGFGKGYDHNFVLNRHTLEQPVARVSSPLTGIRMEVFTTEPGLQFYSGNFLTGKDKDGKGGVSYPFRSAFCLETQHFPDSPNKENFPSTVLKPGAEYQSTTIYKFSK
ncbi:aldose epimerase family protein [Pedobacter foliorum]|uniref:aldose epimerase family protein n=1 Tax=Pedobacter foliorum TaxID=2739058 RepID=UPI001567AC39|nr:aldose epimerase family protein [Pedobacter foliorum]NRF37803.1 galactose mutarotase [Pedobacter foliorum]